MSGWNEGAVFKTLGLLVFIFPEWYNKNIVKGVAVMAQISLRVDDDVKRGAEQALSDNWIKHVCRCQYFFT